MPASYKRRLETLQEYCRQAAIENDYKLFVYLNAIKELMLEIGYEGDWQNFCAFEKECIHFYYAKSETLGYNYIVYDPDDDNT